ncbi:MAG: hypothetical protein AUK33_02470 [Flavobacteriaceae bacterium CG2_30_34_30]|nr:MAG: hypothetical protein AUK33_02470 [Flavobacteriaceae bacterium CG2_30_34_30]PIZ08780.1 MAG: hypothetical protein COY56_02125 [Flavobacteriaceae bacterium CG_4_10_14_0_8_um_filter_34_31]
MTIGNKGVIFHLFNSIVFLKPGGLPFEYIGWFEKIVNGQFIFKGEFLTKNRKKTNAKNMVFLLVKNAYSKDKILKGQ